MILVSDACHAYFVTALEGVRDSLKHLLKGDAFDMNSLKSAIPTAKVIANDRARGTPLRSLFEILDVYEPSAEFLVAPDVVPSPKAAEVQFTVQVPDNSILRHSLL